MAYECHTEYGVMGMLYVAPEVRGQGVGSFLTSKMADLRFQDGGHSAVVQIKEDNSASIRLHQRLGFKVTCRADIVVHLSHRGQQVARQKGVTPIKSDLNDDR